MSRVDRIATTGQLRAVLADAVIAVRDGTMKAEDARNITKLAAQVTESLRAEIKAAEVSILAGKNVTALGTLSIE